MTRDPQRCANGAAKRPPQGRTPEGRPRRLPPLNLFRAFDAAARHLSFTAAAEELLVTQSAVSQQIRQLEEFLDVRLFRRLPRGLELTREGTALSGTVAEALNMIGRACGKLVDPDAPALLCVNATPAFASKWLAPRLKTFMELHPNIRVTLLSSPDPVSFNRQDIDVAIRWGRGRWDGAHAELMVREPIVGLCSPELAAAAEYGLVAGELARHTLLQVINQPNWMAWLEEHGISGLAFNDTLYFSDANLMLEAAVQGQGVCFTTLLLAEGDLRSGRLVRVSDVEVPCEESFYVLCSPDMVDKPKISVFRDWLLSESRRTVEEARDFGALPDGPPLRASAWGRGTVRQGGGGGGRG